MWAFVTVSYREINAVRILASAEMMGKPLKLIKPHEYGREYGVLLWKQVPDVTLLTQDTRGCRS